MTFPALSYFIFSGSGFCLRVLLSLSCISYHVILCIAFAYVFISCIRAFSPLSVLHSGASFSSGGHFYLFLCVGIKHFRIGPILAKRTWFTTGRPPVKFRTIWTSFDTPTVNRGPRRPRVCCIPTSKWPKTHQNPLHHLEHSITIAWPQTVLNLEPPSSLYIYI